jgi:hypothetical protein
MSMAQTVIDIDEEAAQLVAYMKAGDPCASVCLARLLEADHQGVFWPFAEALAARLRDHLHRWAELGVTDPEQTLAEDVYQLVKRAAVDWDHCLCEDEVAGKR